jgi:phosphatidate cytidylyltransferase
MPAQSPLDVSKGSRGANAPSKRSELPARIVAGLALMALALGVVWAGFYWFMAFWLIAAALVNWEWQTLVGGKRRVLRVALGAAALAVGAVFAVNGEAPEAVLIVLISAALAGLAGRDVWSGGGVVYAGALLIAVCALRSSEEFGARAILWLFALVWGVDIMAYFGGRLIGGPKLWPRVSPGKTWSGFVVGVICGAAASAFFSPEGGAKTSLFVLGLAGGALAQAGDLFESAIKRRFGVKDSSHLIPGHGGLMDRLDGFIAAAIFAAAVGVMRAGLPHAAKGLLQW